MKSLFLHGGLEGGNIGFVERSVVYLRVLRPKDAVHKLSRSVRQIHHGEMVGPIALGEVRHEGSGRRQFGLRMKARKNFLFQPNVVWRRRKEPDVMCLASSVTGGRTDHQSYTQPAPPVPQQFFGLKNSRSQSPPNAHATLYAVVIADVYPVVALGEKVNRVARQGR